MDLTNLEDALNNGNFKEQVYSGLDGVYRISKVLNQLDLLKNFSEHDLEIVGGNGWVFHEHSQAIVYEILK
ncbi:hypothetical protein [Helicobacter phage 1961P]|uniref:Uncharacterized protein n=1 Tax=Helicobacter phage 1961P TaxID=1154995 RepID=I6P4B4_9CAUD|nr:hypothetical protein F419_gp25 [Helicobacter phage 1961P]AFC61924.1 hypothetical protein [Helicobacter phage 1961P]